MQNLYNPCVPRARILLALTFCSCLFAACQTPNITTPRASVVTAAPTASSLATARARTAAPVPSTATRVVTPNPARVLIPAPLPQPKLEIGATTTERCGDYFITQTTLSVFDEPRVAALTVSNAQAQIMQTFDVERWGAQEISRVLCADLTGDNIPELVMESFSGGAHCCFEYEIVELKINLPRIFAWRGGSGSLTELAQLKPDAAYEIVGMDDRFTLFDDLPFAAAPFLPVVFVYRDGAYRTATRDFPALILEDQQSAVPDLDACDGADYCRGAALQYYADGLLLGRGDVALGALREKLPADIMQWLDEQQDAIRERLAE